jgi:hypothetical protein
MDFQTKALLIASTLGVLSAVVTPCILRNRFLCTFIAGFTVGILLIVGYLYYVLELSLHRYDASAQRLICTIPEYPTITAVK